MYCNCSLQTRDLIRARISWASPNPLPDRRSTDLAYGSKRSISKRFGKYARVNEKSKPGVHRLQSDVTPFSLLNSNDFNSSRLLHSGKRPPIPDITTSNFGSAIFGSTTRGSRVPVRRVLVACERGPRLKRKNGIRGETVSRRTNY